MRRWLALMTVLTSWACAHPAEAQSIDYCKTSERSILFLIDRTTDYDQQDEETLVGGLDRFFKELGTSDRLLLYTIGANAADSRRLFDACVPGCPEEGLFSGLLSACKSVVARADRQRFTRELLTTLIGLLKQHVDYDASAIVETIQSVMESNRNDHLARLVIFSDMLQNSDLLTFRQLVQKGAEAASRRVEAAALMPDLQGVAVDAFGIGRSHVKGRPGLSPAALRLLKTFWQDVFQRGGAASVAIGPEYAPIPN